MDHAEILQTIHTLVKEGTKASTSPAGDDKERLFSVYAAIVVHCGKGMERAAK